MTIPMSVEEITAEWVEAILKEKFGDVAIEAIAVRQVFHGAATKFLIDIVYRRDTGKSAPDAICVKIGYEQHSRILNKWGIYDNESFFYTSILPNIDVNVPEYFYQKSQDNPPQVVLVLEDLTRRGVTFGRATRPMTMRQVATGLRTLARLHAYTWNDPTLLDQGLRPVLTWGIGVPLRRDIETRAAKYFAEPRGYSVAVSLHDPERLAAGWARYCEEVLKGPMCVVHSDTHVGNTFIEPDGGIGFLDWQCGAIGHWSHDVAYFMVTALDVPDRRAAERELLSGYLDALKALEIDAPCFEEAWLSYRKALIFPFGVWLTNYDTYQPPEVNIACFSRAGTAMLDHDVYDLLQV